MNAPVFHHVYTSVRGYRTQYASPGIEGSLGALEDLAQRIYPRVAGRPIRGLIRANGEGGEQAVGMAFFHAFPYQTDEYGRPRACVHTVFVPPETVRASPFLNPIAAVESASKSPFMGPKHAVETVGGFLPSSIECPEFEEQYGKAVALLQHPDGHGRVFIRALLRALMSGSITTVTVAQPDVVIRALADMWPLLPPRVRHRFQYVRSFTGQLDLGPFGAPKLMLAGYAGDVPDLGEIEARGHVVIDMARKTVSENLPAESQHVGWLAEHVAADDKAVPRVLRFLEAYDPPAETAYYALNHLGQAVGILAPILDEEGLPEPAKDLRAAAAALVPLCRAGMLDAVAAIIEAMIGLDEGPKALSQSAVAALRSARDALDDYGPETERFLWAAREAMDARGGPAEENETITRLALPVVRRKPSSAGGKAPAGQEGRGGPVGT